ncbi:MAG: hypothetical protein ACI96M_004094 [Candidatus Azotimanducaceae bacterium]|jgi:hypothetical protein
MHRVNALTCNGFAEYFLGYVIQDYERATLGIVFGFGLDGQHIPDGNKL